jgi:hypothetical protein
MRGAVGTPVDELARDCCTTGAIVAQKTARELMTRGCFMVEIRSTTLAKSRFDVSVAFGLSRESHGSRKVPGARRQPVD